MQRKVQVKNLSTGRVFYTIPNLNVQRRFLPGMTIELPFDEVQQGLYEYGIRVMFTDGLLTVVGDRDAIDLGLKIGQGVIDVPPADDTEILKHLRGSAIALNKFLENASPVVKENAGALAVQNRITEPGKVKIIERHTGVNVLAALKRESDILEPSKKEE